ncbi:hypothetical protein [Clavibacter capsici]|uniref:hypothetical protein n=1 Tax=Clavibacter capsici TaxID=1874630 RepID=UPI0014286549|nr:hypothetical protein [Clavibacter capsici]QIS40491.1 hypothetical protein GW572_14975 [Clavibacter capsici]
MPQPPMWFSTSVQVCGIYPFGVGTGRPTDGAPLGRCVDTGTAVCTDHEALYRADVISSPSAFLLGINGVGKSSTAQTILLGQMGRGLTPAVYDPIKGEHVPMIRAAGGKVFSIGPGSGRDKLNIVSPGPLGAAASRIGGRVGAELSQLARDKAVALVQLNARVSRGAPLDDIEDAALEAIVDTLREREPRPVTQDLVTVFDVVSERMLHVTGRRDAADFHARFARLGETLRAMLAGRWARCSAAGTPSSSTPATRVASASTRRASTRRTRGCCRRRCSPPGRSAATRSTRTGRSRSTSNVWPRRPPVPATSTSRP